MMQFPPDRNVLYFSDLPKEVTEEDLKLFLAEYSDKIVRIYIDKNPFPSRGFQQEKKDKTAKVIFKDKESANTVRIKLNLTKIHGKSVRIMWDEKDYTVKFNTVSNLYIKNIPIQTTPREVYEYFIKFGDISSLKITEDENGIHKGYGYVTYYRVEDAERALKESDEKKIFGDAILKVEHFHKKNERNVTPAFIPEPQPLVIKNIPQNITEEKLTEICEKYGKVKSCQFKIYPGKKHAILKYENDESVQNALIDLPKIDMGDGAKVIVEVFQNQYERSQKIQIQSQKYYDQLYQKTNDCNLHIRNIPYPATEDDLRKNFSKFGKIESVKIERYILEVQEKGQFVEKQASKEFGYICFDNPESAKKAMEEMNNKFLIGYESWKKPLIIEKFMNKKQRQQVIVNYNMPPPGPNISVPPQNVLVYPSMPTAPYMMPPSYPGQRILDPSTYMRPLNMNLNMNHANNLNPHYVKRGGAGIYPPQQHPGRFPYNNRPPYPRGKSQAYEMMQINNMNPSQNPNTSQAGGIPSHIVQKPTTASQKKLSEAAKSFNAEEFKAIEDIQGKREYLGELIFKAIEESPLASKNNMDVNIIGRITGMIIEIPDINEVVEILMNEDQLESRINEGLELSKQD